MPGFWGNGATRQGHIQMQNDDQIDAFIWHEIMQPANPRLQVEIRVYSRSFAFQVQCARR